MDREDLDQQLKEHGEAMQKEITGSRKGRMKLFAAALALLVIGGAGGCFGDGIYCFFGDILSHPDGAEIVGFAKKHKIKAVSLSDEPLSDHGGFIVL